MPSDRDWGEKVTVWYCDHNEANAKYALEASFLADDEFDYELRKGCSVCSDHPPVQKTQLIPLTQAEARLSEAEGIAAVGWARVDAAEARIAELEAGLREFVRYLDSTGDCGDHHIRLGEACGMDACVLCLIEARAAALLRGEPK